MYSLKAKTDVEAFHLSPENLKKALQKYPDQFSIIKHNLKTMFRKPSSY